MTDTFDNIVAFQPKKIHRPCRTAYTMDGVQPVACTIIGEDPLFYMDCSAEIIEEEMPHDELFEDPFFDFIDEEEVAAPYLDHELFVSAAHETVSPVECLNAFTNAVTRAVEESHDKASTLSLIEELRTSLFQSRLASALLEFAEDAGYALHMCKHAENVEINSPGMTIEINPYLQEEDRILLTIRALRQIWQNQTIHVATPLSFDPDDAILFYRSKTADLAVMTVRAAWELQLAGIQEPWDRLIRSSMADMAHAFAREAFFDFRTVNNGIACAAAFETWFLSERCRHADRDVISQMLADPSGKVFDPKNRGETLTVATMASIGSLPFGRNYLAAHVPAIMEDPLFHEVRDRSNANFLWFVKFERSFAEAEQALQAEEIIHSPPGADDSNDTQESVHHETQEIIYLFPPEPSSGDKNKQSRCKADIIPFRRETSRI